MKKNFQSGTGYIKNVAKKVIVLMSVCMAVSVFSPVVANPTGGQVSVGSATISAPDANTVQINQTSDKAIINWNSFNIAPNEKTHFQQPNTSSVTLNRVDPTQGVSQIFGQLTANGRIILINPAGVYFGPGSYVNVGGLIVSTSNMSNENFNAGNYIFDQPSSYHGSVINAGTIKAGDSGLVALLGTSVRNDGLIVVRVGSVVLASGNKFTFDFSGDQLINFAVDAGATHYGVDKDGNTLSDSVSNNGKIISNGGQVIMTAKSVGGVLNSTINMKGVVVANSFKQKNGSIIFSSGGGAVKVSGKVIARSGNVKVLAKHVTIDGNATINVSGNSGGGEILIGGDYKGLNPAIANAETTFVGSGVKIYADALQVGNGGKVIVWADDSTYFFGHISAKGGPAGGNGGFVETSGKNYLDIAGGRVNASAPLGAAGTWLLDPRNVAINNSATTCTTPPCFSGGNPDIYTPDTNTSNVNVADILAALEAGTSVTITTGTTGIQVGTIAVNAAIAKTLGATAVTLTLDSTNAGGTITVSSAISSTSGALSVSLLSGNAIQINETITTNGGNFIATAQNGITIGNGAGTTPGVINAGSGTVAFNANQDGAGANNFLMNPNSSITTTNNTSSAVQILVNTAAGGTANASLRAITAGATGKILVSTDGTNNGTGNTTGTTITTTASTTIAGGDVSFIAPTTITHNGSINTAGIVSMIANTSLGGGDFTMAAGSSITTTDASASAVTINVNKAGGGTGTAALRDITVGNGGTITVSTDTGGNVTGGDITQPSGVLTATAGTINLTNPNVTGINIGTAGANIQISTGSLTFTTGTAGGFFTNTGTGSLNLGTITTSGAFSLTSTSSAGITDSGTLAITGTTTLVAGATQNITLNTATNDFSTIAITSANDVTLVDTNALNFGASTISGNLNVTAGGDLTDSTTVSVAGTATFAVGANNITLDTATNNFNIVGITNANNVTLRDAGAIVFDNATISGDLALTTAGAVTQSVGTSLLVNGVGKTATFVAGAGNNITLDNSTNDFTRVVVTSGNNVSLRDTNAMQFGASTSTISGTLGVVTGGSLTQLGGALIVSGLATLNPGSSNSITLDNSTNNFSSVSIVNALSASLRDTNALDMAVSTVVNTLTLVAGNTLTQSGILTVPTLSAITRLTGGAAITLSNVGNMVNTITLQALNTAGTANAAGAITFSNAQGFDVAAIGTTSTISLTAVGAISDSGTIAGSTLTTSSVGGTILDFGATLTGFNAINITSGNIQLINTGALTVATGISQSGNGSVDISNTGALTLTGNLNTNAGTGAVGLHATTNMTLNGSIDAGSGTVTLDANTSGGAFNYTMNAGSSITTTNTSATAVAINVNSASGGTGTAALRDITVGNGGTISVRTDTGSNATGGDITQASGVLNSGSAGTVTLINPHIGGNNVGTAALPIHIIAGTLDALSANNGIFITNDGTSALTVKTFEAFRSDTLVKGIGQIISNGVIQQTGISSAVNVLTLTLKTLDNLGANITFNNSSNVATNINLSTRNAADTADAAGVISYQGSGTNISGLETSSNATINVSGALTDSGTITVAGTLTVTTVGGMVLDNAKQVSIFNGTNSGGGNMTLTGNTAALIITGASQSGGGNITFTDSTDITVANNATVSTGGGTASFTSTTGTLTLGSNAIVTSGGNTITINTTDINLDPTSSLSSGTGNMTITQNTASGSIGLGNTAGTLTLSGAELERITANNLTLVAPTNGQIIVDGITASNVANIAGTVTLTATAGTLGSIAFQNNPSVFKALTANADNGITVNESLSTTVGILTLSGGSILNLNNDLTAAGVLTLTATGASGIVLGASVTLTGDGITFNDTVNGAFDLTLDAGSSGDITFTENVGDVARLGLLEIINVDELDNQAIINATTYTQLAGNLTELGTGGMDLTGAANVVGTTINGALNVGSLILNVSFANLTGFVDGSSGQAAIAKIVNVNTIGPGTHFFDGIDMYAAPIPPQPPQPTPYNGRIPSIAFAYLYGLSEDTDNDSGVAMDADYLAMLAMLDDGRKKCVKVSYYLTICAAPTSSE